MDSLRPFHVGTAGRMLAACVVALAYSAVTGTASGAESETSTSTTTKVSTSFQQTLTEANNTYTDGNYEEALTKYVDASQVNPTDPFPYLGIARSYFWLDRYPAAVYHYDLFLQTVGDTSEARQQVAKHVEPARSERKLAASRAEGRAWQRPEAQRRLVNALRDQLDEGAAYTPGGGGAWALYKALLRTNYADPELARLQRRLARKLLDEVNRRMTPAPNNLVPRRSLADWEEDFARLEAAGSLATGERFSKRVESRRRVVSAGIAMLNGNHAQAADGFSKAIESITEWNFLNWLRIACLIRAERYNDANRAISEARDKPFVTSDIQRYLTLMEGLIAHRRGNDKAAAETFHGLLSADE